MRSRGSWIVWRLLEQVEAVVVDEVIYIPVRDLCVVGLPFGL